LFNPLKARALPPLFNINWFIIINHILHHFNVKVTRQKRDNAGKTRIGMAGKTVGIGLGSIKIWYKFFYF
jgi:hypothetical protein